MKPCRSCGASFEPSAWQLRKRDLQCVPCRRAARKEFRARRKDEGRPVRGGQMPREWHRNYEAKYFAHPENRERRNALMRSYGSRPEIQQRRMARRQVRSALERGEMKKCPCVVCGAARVDAHHADYSKPLAVTWLCRIHHAEIHAKALGQRVLPGSWQEWRR